MLALVVAAAAINLLGAVVPPFEYDELEYHLGAPSEYLKAGRILFLPHNFYSNMPQLTEMLYLLAMVVRSDVAAKLLHWSFGLLSAMAVYSVASRRWSSRVGMTAAALFYAVPFVQDLSQTARIIRQDKDAPFLEHRMVDFRDLVFTGKSRRIGIDARSLHQRRRVDVASPAQTHRRGRGP